MRRVRIAAWIGILAICTQAYLPVCFASELSAMFGPGGAGHQRHATTARHQPQHASHRSDQSGGNEVGHKGCLICQGALGSGACLTPPIAELPLPRIVRPAPAIRVDLPISEETGTVCYSSRAPPARL